MSDGSRTLDDILDRLCVRLPRRRRKCHHTPVVGNRIQDAICDPTESTIAVKGGDTKGEKKTSSPPDELRVWFSF
jgi:hypothetical protein